MRGTELQNIIDGAVGKTGTTLDQATQTLRAASGLVDRLVAEQVQLVSQTAKLVATSGVKGGGRVGEGLRSELTLREENRHSTKESLSQRRKELVAARATLQEAEMALDAAQEHAETLRRAALADLRSQTAAGGSFDRLEQLEGVLERARAKVAQAQQDAQAKIPAYENDPLFSYLLKRQFGQRGYEGSRLTAMLDGWVARLINFPRYLPDYQRLQEIPVRMTEHVNDLVRERDDLGAQVDKARAQACAAWPGSADADAAVKKHRTAAEKVRAQVRTLEAHVEQLDDALTAFAQGNDIHTKRAMDMVAETLLRTSTAEARALVSATDTDEDDRALERLKALQSDIAKAMLAVDKAKAAQAQARERHEEASNFRSRFKSAGLGRSDKRYSSVDGDNVTTALLGAVALDSLFSDIKRNARTIDDTPSYSSSSSSSRSSSSSSSSSDSGFGGGFSTGGGSGGGGFSTGGGF